jgi:hypothetical protein
MFVRAVGRPIDERQRSVAVSGSTDELFGSAHAAANVRRCHSVALDAVRDGIPSHRIPCHLMHGSAATREPAACAAVGNEALERHALADSALPAE